MTARDRPAGAGHQRSSPNDTVMATAIPGEDQFLGLFTRAAENARDAARMLLRMADEEAGALEQHWRLIEDAEHEGDRITHHIIRMLNRTFLTSIDREDIHNLTVALDDVVDSIESVAARMHLYRLKHPPANAKRLIELVAKAAEEIVAAIANLPRMDGVMPHCIAINRLENMADDVYREAIAGLFDGTLDPIDVIKWKDVFEALEATTDRCEDVADVVESIALKQA
jgi:predicted phosphate transport protein (TIGR00153 family)